MAQIEEVLVSRQGYVRLVCQNRVSYIEAKVLMKCGEKEEMKSDRIIHSKVPFCGFLRTLVGGKFLERRRSEIQVAVPEEVISVEPNGVPGDSLESILRSLMNESSLQMVVEEEKQRGTLLSLLAAAKYFQADFLVETCIRTLENGMILPETTLCESWKLAAELSEDHLWIHCYSIYKRWQKTALLRRFCAKFGGVKSLQIGLCIDTTGSMGACLGQMRSKIGDLFSDIDTLSPGKAEFAALSHGDYCDSSVIRSVDFTSSEYCLNFLSTLTPAGGGPTPEAYEYALHRVRGLNWKNHDPTCGKVLLVIGDSHPHVPSYTTENYFWKEEADELAKIGVHICGVSAAGASLSCMAFLQELSFRTNGIFIDLGEGQVSLYNDSNEGENWQILSDCITNTATIIGSNIAEDDAELCSQIDSIASELLQDIPPLAIELQTIENEKKDEWDESIPDEPWWERKNDHGQPLFSLGSSNLWERIH